MMQPTSLSPGALPRPDTAADTTTLAPQIGRAARRILTDTTLTMPGRIASWAEGVWEAAVALAPRIAVALLSVVIVLALTAWLRASARQRHPEAGEAAGRGVAISGGLVAGILAAALLGWTTLAAALLTFAVFYALSALLAVASARARRRAQTPEVVDLAALVARYALLVLGAVEALGILGINLGGVIAGLGILGLAVGFAAQDTFANLISGFLILWDRSLRVGDWVRVGEAEGRVRRITLRTTRVETRDEGILVIPNKDVTGSRLFNYSLHPTTRLRVPVGVSYATDVDAARAALLSLVPEEPIVRRDPPPFVAVSALGDSAVVLELVLFLTDPAQLVPMRWRLQEAVLAGFRRHGIEIAFPQLDVHLRPAAPGALEGGVPAPR